MKTYLPAFALAVLTIAGIMVGSVIPSASSTKLMIVVASTSDQSALAFADRAELHILDRGPLPNSLVVTPVADRSISEPFIENLYSAGALLVLDANPAFGCVPPQTLTDFNPHPFSNLSRDIGA